MFPIEVSSTCVSIKARTHLTRDVCALFIEQSNNSP